MGGKIFTRTPANYIMVSALARGYTWMSASWRTHSQLQRIASWLSLAKCTIE